MVNEDKINFIMMMKNKIPKYKSDIEAGNSFVAHPSAT